MESLHFRRSQNFIIISIYLSLNKIFYDTLFRGTIMVAYKDFSSLFLDYFFLSFFRYHSMASLFD
jgi:hypothetical protein